MSCSDSRWLITVKHAYEIGTLGFHLTSIMLAACALTTDRSKCPKDPITSWCEERQRTGRKTKLLLVRALKSCEKSLDWDGPVTEVQTLEAGRDWTLVIQLDHITGILQHHARCLGGASHFEIAIATLAQIAKTGESGSACASMSVATLDRAYLEHPARGGRSKLLRSSGPWTRGRATNFNQPLTNPARFSQYRYL